MKFAQDNLFSPLGISVDKNIYFQSKEEQLDFYKSKGANGWVADPNGTNTAGWGLSLTRGSISLFMKSTLSFTLGTNKEETATTIRSLGLTYIAFPPSPKAAYECPASSMTHHKYPYFRRRAFQTLNLDEKVIDFFPDYQIRKGEKTIQHITIRHLLTMTAPYKFKSAILPYSFFILFSKDTICFMLSGWPPFHIFLIG